MQLTITARHGEVPDALRERAAEVVEHLGRVAHRPTSAHVEFGAEGPKALVSIVINAARGATHVARATAVDHRTALDRVAAKLRKQFDKAVERPARRAARKAASR